MQRREYPRMEVGGLSADISDGKCFFSGTVANLSREGLAISSVAGDLEESSDIYSVVLDGPGTHFKLLVRPIWERYDGATRTIGARIENSPWSWTDYVMHREPLATGLSPS